MKTPIIVLIVTFILGYIAFNHVYAWFGVLIPAGGVIYFINSLIKFIKSKIV